MSASPDDVQDLLTDFAWLEAIMEFLTAGGSETLSIVMPSFIYGVLMVGYFTIGRSPIMPVVLSIIFAGVVFAFVPTAVGTIVGIAVLGALATGGLILMWRMGQTSP